jgi:dethiobiotin synthetase
VSARPARLVAVVGTETEVGKTWVTARLAVALADAGHAVAARKPAQSFDPADDPATTDAAVLGASTGEPAEAVCPRARWYAAAMAPPMAARALGRPGFTVGDLAAEVALSWPLEGTAEVGLVETAGGVRSPQADDGDATDLLRLLSPDAVVLVADAGLGVINAVRLCTGALAGLGGPRPVVVLNRFDAADAVHRANRAWLADHDGLATLALPGTEKALCRAVLS